MMLQNEHKKPIIVLAPHCMHVNVEIYIVIFFRPYPGDCSTTFVQLSTMFITFPQVLDRGVMGVGHVVVAVDEGIPVDIGDVTEVIPKCQRETLQVQLAQ